MADLRYKLVDLLDVPHIYYCETLEITLTTVTGINTAKEIVFMSPVTQIKLLTLEP
jgi:hypothetical protein